MATPDAQGPLQKSEVLLRLGAIGAVMLCVAAAFAYTAGWFSPERLTQDLMMEAFDDANGGAHPGFRHNHAKGVCVTGWFESGGQAVPLSKATLFQPGSVPVVGRFALAGGMPFQTDAPATVRSLALRFLPPGGEEWRTGMNNIPVFPVNSARGFYDLISAQALDPTTGKPNPARMKAFLADHPEAAQALSIITKRPISSGFADSTFNGLDAFRFVNAAGVSVPVRWSAVPMQPFEADSGVHGPDGNYLFRDLIAQIVQHPLKWRLIVTVGQAGDPTGDATLPWPADRRQIDAGTVTIDRASSEDGGSCTDVNYDPLVLPPGIEASDDPLLSARSATYAESFTERAEEKREKPPSAVTPQDVAAGGKP